MPKAGKNKPDKTRLYEVTLRFTARTPKALTPKVMDEIVEGMEKVLTGYLCNVTKQESYHLVGVQE